MAKTPRPLTIMKFYILLSLARQPQHGYGIHAQVVSDSNSSLHFSFTSLYRLLGELEKAGLVTSEKVGVGPKIKTGSDRRVYQITSSGLSRLKWEATDLEKASRLAKQRLP